MCFASATYVAVRVIRRPLPAAIARNTTMASMGERLNARKRTLRNTGRRQLVEINAYAAPNRRNAREFRALGALRAGMYEKGDLSTARRIPSTMIASAVRSDTQGRLDSSAAESSRSEEHTAEL